MTLVRRRFLRLAAAAVAAPATTGIVLAQAPQGGPKLTQILRNDLQAQDQKVQETVVNVLEMAPGVGAPWHMHPAAQEILFVIEGSLTVEIEGQGTKVLKAGEIALMPAEVPHLARNDGHRRGKSVGDPQPSRQGKAVCRRGEKGDVETARTALLDLVEEPLDHVAACVAGRKCSSGGFLNRDKGRTQRYGANIPPPPRRPRNPPTPPPKRASM
jgi:quercetin dioxygenase-like cupin family protein